MSASLSSARASHSKTSEVFTRAPFPGNSSGLFLPKESEGALLFFVPAAVMHNGSTTLDPRLFIAEADSRQLRTMAVFFMHVCNLIGEMQAPRDTPTIFSERLVLSSKGLPAHLDVENPDPEQMLEYARDNPTTAVEGYMYTLRFARDANVRIQKSAATVAAERSMELKASHEAKDAAEPGTAPPKKKAVQRSASVPFVQAAMHKIYSAYKDPKKADALDQEFMKLIPSHKELRAALYAYTREADYIQAPCPSADASFAQDKHLFNPLSIFTLTNCHFERYLVHPACLRDLYGGSWAPASLCRRVRPEEAAVDRFFRYRFLHYQEPTQSYDDIRAAIPVDGIIRGFLVGECKDPRLRACFSGYTSEELKVFVTTRVNDLPPAASTRYAALKRALQEAEFEASRGFYIGGLRSKSLPLFETTLEDLEQENKAAKRELNAKCATFNRANSSNPDLQREHARFRRQTFQRKALQRLVDVLEAGKVSETARVCFLHLKAYLEKNHNFYFPVRGGYGAYWQQQIKPACSSASTSSACVGSASSSGSSAAAAVTTSSSSNTLTNANGSGKKPAVKLQLDRSADVAYNLPSFARDVAGALDRYFAVAFSHRLTFEAFLRACYVFFDRPLYLNMLVSGAPGCGKSMIGVILKEFFPKGVVVELSHMSPCALAVPNGPVRSDQIFVLDEFGPQFTDPSSTVMRMLLSVLSGADYGADVLDLNKETSERKNLQVRVRDRRTLFAFTNFSPKQIYAAMTDRMTCYTIAPSVSQTDAVEKYIQRAEQALRDKAVQEEKQKFLESTRLVSSLMMMVSKMINVGILELPSTSCAVDRIAALNDALRSMGVSLGSTRKKSVALALLDVATAMDAVLRVFACGPEDARIQSMQSWGSLLDVDPFLIPSEATQAFVLSLAHHDTEDRLQSAILDFLCGQVFSGSCEDHYSKRSVMSKASPAAAASQDQDKKDLAQSADASITSYQPSPQKRTVIDKDVLQHVALWPAHLPGASPVERLAHVLSQNAWIASAGDVTPAAILSTLQRLCEQTITVHSAETVNKFQMSVLQVTEVSPPFAVEANLMSPSQRASGCHVDALRLPTVVKQAKQPYIPRPVTATREVFSHKFTVPGVYILGMEDEACAAKFRMELFERRSDVPTYKINANHCLDDTVWEASLGLVPQSSSNSVVSRSEEQVEITADPIQETLLARLEALSIPTKQQGHVFLDALLNSRQAVIDAIACARKCSWVPSTVRVSVQKPTEGTAAATHQLAEELEAEQRRQETRKRVDATTSAPKSRPGSLMDIMAEVERKESKDAAVAASSTRSASQFEEAELEQGYAMDSQGHPKRMCPASECQYVPAPSSRPNDEEPEEGYLPNADEASLAAMS